MLWLLTLLVSFSMLLNYLKVPSIGNTLTLSYNKTAGETARLYLLLFLYKYIKSWFANV